MKSGRREDRPSRRCSVPWTAPKQPFMEVCCPCPGLKLLDERTRLAMMLDYEFGKGTSKALPAERLKFYYSRKSDRLKQVSHDGKLFAIIRPNGAIALSLYSASILIASKAFLQNCITVTDEAAQFVMQGKSASASSWSRSAGTCFPGARSSSGMGRDEP